MPILSLGVFCAFMEQKVSILEQFMSVIEYYYIFCISTLSLTLCCYEEIDSLPKISFLNLDIIENILCLAPSPF